MSPRRHYSKRSDASRRQGRAYTGEPGHPIGPKETVLVDADHPIECPSCGAGVGLRKWSRDVDVLDRETGRQPGAFVLSNHGIGGGKTSLRKASCPGSGTSVTVTEWTS